MQDMQAIHNGRNAFIDCLTNIYNPFFKDLSYRPKSGNSGLISISTISQLGRRKNFVDFSDKIWQRTSEAFQ